jgi:hypothetical protein
MNRALLCLLAFAICACNPLPPTPDEEEKAAAAKARAAAKPSATPRKAGDWIYDNQKDRLNTNDKDKQGKPADPLKFNTKLNGGSTPRKDGRYDNPLDKKAPGK